jgi:molecular chaperone DnaJ
MTAAALGCSIPLETFEGSMQIEIEPGTQSGHVIKRRGEGVPHLRGHGRGDLLIQVEVTTPKKLDTKQEALMRELAKLRNEENPTGVAEADDSGLFSRLRDAFGGR